MIHKHPKPDALTRLALLLRPETPSEPLVAAAAAALGRYSVLDDLGRRSARLVEQERSGELPLSDRLLQCLPEDGNSWLNDELWDHCEEVFECSWGDTGEEWLAAILGPETADEAQASALEDGIVHVFETAYGIPGWSARRPPPLAHLVDFIRDWRETLLGRLERRIDLGDTTAVMRQS